LTLWFKTPKLNNNTAVGGTNLGFIKCHLSRILGERRISQRELARMSGLSNFTVNKFYNERWQGIDQDTLVKLCKALNVQVGELLEYVETESAIKGKGKRK
jgi:putative transcriptional regulator